MLLVLAAYIELCLHINVITMWPHPPYACCACCHIDDGGPPTQLHIQHHHLQNIHHDEGDLRMMACLIAPASTESEIVGRA